MSKRPATHEGPFSKGTELELEITTLTNMGQGLGRVQLPDTHSPVTAAPNTPDSTSETGDLSPRTGGWVILVPFALPGELVRVRVWRNQRNFSDADLVEIMRPAPH